MWLLFGRCLGHLGFFLFQPLVALFLTLETGGSIYFTNKHTGRQISTTAAAACRYYSCRRCYKAWRSGNLENPILKWSSVDPSALTILRPGLDSLGQLVRFFHFMLELWCEKDENKQKRPGMAHFIKMVSLFLITITLFLRIWLKVSFDSKLKLFV